jgi:enamine deaminase RidA (YjgF/YER057c/UK114 family)
MLARCLVSCGLSLAAITTLAFAQSPSPNGVVTLNPRGAISTGTDTWSVGARAGDFIFVAGMQGVNPATNKLVEGDEARIRQAFLNLKLIAESAGATLQDCVRLTVYVSDLHRFAPLVSKVQAELWGKRLIRRVPCSRFSASSTMTSSRSTASSTHQQRSEFILGFSLV